MARFFKVRDVARLLGVTEQTVREYCADGRLPGARRLHPSGSSPWVIPVSALGLSEDEVDDDRATRADQILDRVVATLSRGSRWDGRRG